MDIRYYIGIDISKATALADRLDWAVFDGKATVLQTQTENSEKGIKTAIRQIADLAGFSKSEIVCCLEHSGIYNAHLLTHLHKLHIPLWLENCRVGGPI